MASIETRAFVVEKGDAAPLQEPKVEEWKPSGLAADVVALGAGTALAAVFNTLSVFLIPRLLGVKDFGYWRLFLLYSAYVGLLHLGLADGALLRWAGRSLEDIRPEIGPSLRFLFWQQLAVIIPGIMLCVFFLRWPLNLVGAAVLVYSVIFNSTALLQFSLQAARLFRPVAIATAAPACGFVLMAFVWYLQGTLHFQGLIGLYCFAGAAVLAYLWNRVRPRAGSNSEDSAWTIGKTCIAVGWPVMVANGGLVLVQSADRLVVSSVLPIYEFAQYSLAASTMFVPVAAIAAVYRVFFSHVAAVAHEGRARVYAHASKILLLAWSLLLPYYFVLDMFVRHFLPKYVPALPVAEILLLGVMFLAGIQILHMSFAYLYGRQRQFLLVTVCALLASLSVALVMATWLRSLVAVAIGQVGALAFWWLVNEWNLRGTSGQRWKDALRVISVFAWSTFSFVVAIKGLQNLGLRLIVYYALVVGCLVLTCHPEMKILWTLLSRRLLQVTTH